MAPQLRILHVFRDPVGGIFRHVRDLLSAQHESGHDVGFICDSNTGGDYEDRLFEEIRPQLTLGLHRIPMTRSIAPQDILSVMRVAKLIRSIKPDVVHAHSAKGGVYGRLGAKFGSSHAKAFYCPHGGAMHYGKNSLKGKVFFTAERFLERFTDSLIFVSDYERRAYHDKVGQPKCPEHIVFNGLNDNEFEPVHATDKAADFLYIGMKRDLKGPDVFINALAKANKRSDKNITAWFVGDGPDEAKYGSQIKHLGLKKNIFQNPAMPARKAFELARTVVVPSRAESMPYLVLEAAAAHKPLICTNVGGIPEIFPDAIDQLVEPGNPEALADAMLKNLSNVNTQQNATNIAENLKQRFSLAVMASDMEAVYRS